MYIILPWVLISLFLNTEATGLTSLSNHIWQRTVKKFQEDRKPLSWFLAWLALAGILPDQWGSLFPKTLLLEVWRQSQTEAQLRQSSCSENTSLDILQWHREACTNQSQICSLVAYFNLNMEARQTWLEINVKLKLTYNIIWKPNRKPHLDLRKTIKQ